MQNLEFSTCINMFCEISILYIQAEEETLAASERAEMLQDIDPNTLKTMDWRRLQVCTVIDKGAT